VHTLADVDWERWSPEVCATLLFVVRDGRILLIHKKRGLGAGKINGPGGKLDPGESPLDGAIREVQEEIGVTPLRVEQRGEIRFQFTDGLALQGYVFLARDCSGCPRESDEAAPFWTAVDRIPYARMWADDVFWMPMLLAGEKFRGRALFDADALLDQRFETLPADHRFEPTTAAPVRAALELER
jgi:8-oxo-dGTP diphosphatase